MCVEKTDDSDSGGASVCVKSSYAHRVISDVVSSCCMAMMVVDDSSLQADSQPKSRGLV